MNWKSGALLHLVPSCIWFWLGPSGSWVFYSISLRLQEVKGRLFPSLSLPGLASRLFSLVFELIEAHATYTFIGK